MKSSPQSSDDAPWRSLYPYRGADLEIDGWRYHYVDSEQENASPVGPRGENPALQTEDSWSRPVILCVHGNPTWSFYWRRVIERFGSEHRVIAVDHLGCGLSDKPSRRDAAYTLEAHRDRLLVLIDRLGLDRIVLLAHDWGGAIGLAAAVERVDRMAGVVLLNTAAFPPPYVPWRIAACRLPVLGTAAMRGLNLFARAAITMAMDKSDLSAEAAAGLLAPYANWHDRVGIDSFVRDIPMTRSHPTYEVLRQLEADLPKLAGVRRCLIWGMKDWCFRPECLERLLRHWPDADAVRIADAGHYVMEDDPTQVLEVIAQFLTRLSDRGGDDGT
ncbi:MAG: alpha/beta fold hydrolase [Planctomycetaceae bacterium]|nr:MAG: alpha/beta fold hydrolase [Planctomycetaceae bacterium]